MFNRRHILLSLLSILQERRIINKLLWNLFILEFERIFQLLFHLLLLIDKWLLKLFANWGRPIFFIYFKRCNVWLELVCRWKPIWKVFALHSALLMHLIVAAPILNTWNAIIFIVPNLQRKVTLFFSFPFLQYLFTRAFKILIKRI